MDGPNWTVQLGRRDSATASLSDANANLPSPFSDLNLLISNFSSKGFSIKELVALSGMWNLNYLFTLTLHYHKQQKNVMNIGELESCKENNKF